MTPLVHYPASGHFYLTRDAGRLCTPSGVRHPGKSSGRRLMHHSSFSTTPHSSFFTTPHSSFFTTPHSSFFLPPLTVHFLPPLTVHFFYHPSQFFFYHPSQFIFHHSHRYDLPLVLGSQVDLVPPSLKIICSRRSPKRRAASTRPWRATRISQTIGAPSLALTLNPGACSQ